MVRSRRDALPSSTGLTVCCPATIRRSLAGLPAAVLGAVPSPLRDAAPSGRSRRDRQPVRVAWVL